MKQLTLHIGSGRLSVRNVPAPLLRRGMVLVANRVSLISTGTERTKILTAQASLLGKARARPDQVQQVLKKLKEAGFAETFRVVRDRLDRDEPLGYSCAGEVLAVADDVPGIRPGDRVACAGAGYANHAEIVAVPKHLCAAVPAGVTFEDAAFVTVGAIALHGVRQASVGLDERILVVGLGLIGQLVVQLVSASGAQAFGADLSEELCATAVEMGARAAAPPGPGLTGLTSTHTAGRAFDAVIVTAADNGTDAFDVALRSVRDRGRIVIVGAVGLRVSNTVKSAIYERELEIRGARSYGPGRYDESYEEGGIDYPLPYVRWTEHRNLEAFLSLVARDVVRPSRLVRYRFPIERSEAAFRVIDRDSERGGSSLAVLLTYGNETSAEVGRTEPTRQPQVRCRRADGRVSVGILGAGNFARTNLLPSLARMREVRLAGVVTGSGLSSDRAARQFGFERAYADPEAMLNDETIDAVLIATRHDTHADLVCRALKVNKCVFVEKPLAVSWEELAAVRDALSGSRCSLTVGFNRRHSDAAAMIKAHFPVGEPLTILYRISAGPLSEGSWYGSLEQGGGRFVGEGGHFIDLVSYLAAARVIAVHAEERRKSSETTRSQDSLVVTLRLSGGSVASLAYLGSGAERFPKERIEVFGAGRTAVIDNFERVHLYADGKRTQSHRTRGKGHRQELVAWIRDLQDAARRYDAGGAIETTAATLAVLESLGTGGPVFLATCGH